MNEKKNDLDNTWVDPDDAPELDDAFFSQATPKIADQVVTVNEAKAAFKKNLGRPKAENPKQAISIRLSPEVLTYFRSTGKGWQTRINEALQEYVASHT
ncbi:MAG: BrnA antitoxin family protein [Chloroflexi bacterium]|nr:BrnA antitoxin family protein [Chloroflexota bacterium]